MNDVERSEDVNGASPNGSGVLANLPRSRPQRSSARRLAARESTSAHNGSGMALREPRKTPSARFGFTRRSSTPKRRAGARARRAKQTVAPVGESAASASAKRSGGEPRGQRERAKGGSSQTPGRAARDSEDEHAPAAAQEPAPRQGFECESDESTGSLQPPGGTELVASAAELVGELAKAGFSRGERLLKDVFSRLPGPELPAPRRARRRSGEDRRGSVYLRPRRAPVTQVTGDGGPNADRKLSVRRGESAALGRSAGISPREPVSSPRRRRQ